MPIDRSVGAAYADRIITLYVEVERELAALIAAKLKRGVAHDDLTQRMLALSEIRRSAEAAMRKIDGKTGPAVELALREAAAAGGRRAQEELLRVRDRRAVGRRLADVDKNLVNSPSILRLAASLAPALDRKLAATHLQVVRSAGDIYQHAVAAMSVPGVLAGVATRREATQKALDHLWRKGITGFVDKAGRGWNLASYVEMATRTTTSHAAIQAHLDQLGQQGMDLVMVSADGAPCPICRPWEGKILTTGAATGPQTIERASELDGSPVKVHIDGSTSEAIAAGLFHPSCRHRFITYLPGLTAPIETAGEGGALYQAEQQQRGLERQARRLAVQQAGAIDPDAAKRYAAAYRAKRAEIKAHVEDHPGLRRKTERERIDLGHAPSSVRPVTPTPKVVALKRVPKAPVSKPVEIVKPIAPATPTPKELSREDLNRIYAGRFKVDGARKDPARLEAQLKDLGAIDERLHERMSKFMSGYTHGGIYIGPGGVLSSAPYALRANYEGPVRGWPAGSTWDDVGGCYSPSSGALIIAESKHELGGRHSTAQHEFGHAVDHMAKEISSSDEYKKLYHDISGHIAFTPYYSQTGNPTGHLSESFAEFFNAYAAARGKSEASMIKAMLTQLGTPRRGTNNIAYAIIKGSAEEARLDPLDRQLLASVRHLIKIFDEIHEGKR